jgi:intraflagellar transport protein 172
VDVIRCCLSGFAGNWEAAQKVARGYLSQAELHSFYSKRAQACEANRQWTDAEKAYLSCGEVDLAINMYQRNKAWLPMLKLVQQQKREQLPQAHLLVAQVREGWQPVCCLHGSQ